MVTFICNKKKKGIKGTFFNKKQVVGVIFTKTHKIYSVCAKTMFPAARVLAFYVFMIKKKKKRLHLHPLPLPYTPLKKPLTLIICYFAGGSLPFC